MGKLDSSRTRVRPVFGELVTRDPSGASWLNELLALPRREGPREPPVLQVPRLQSYNWAAPDRAFKEKSLPAPRALLEWLIEHVEAPTSASAWGRDEVPRRRKRLVERDEVAQAEAREQIARSLAPSWAVLERPSQPDVFLETDEALIVIEGKRTERGPTTDTTWLRGRHQMLRHIDCAWEIRGARAVYGFFIVEGEGGGADALPVPKRWKEAAEATVSAKALAESLPHRSPAERQALADAFLGMTTWQAVCRQVGIDFSALP